MTATATTPDTRSTLTVAQQAALEWLVAKRDGLAAGKIVKAADATRKQAALTLLDQIGEDGLVTVNDGGFTTYRFDIVRQPSTPYRTVIDALLAIHPNLTEQVNDLIARHTTVTEKMALKPAKGV